MSVPTPSPTIRSVAGVFPVAGNIASAALLAAISALPLAGGVMSGNIDMGGNEIDNVGTLNASYLNLTSGGALNTNGAPINAGAGTFTTLAGNGASLTALTAANISGVIPTANLGSGSATSTTYLGGDQAWHSFASAVGTTALLKANNLSDVASAATSLSNLGGIPLSLINADNGVAGTDSAGNITGPIIPYKDTASNLSTKVLLLGQYGWTTDTHAFAIGDGATTFANLPPVGISAVNGATGTAGAGTSGGAGGTVSPPAISIMGGPGGNGSASTGTAGTGGSTSGSVISVVFGTGGNATGTSSGGNGGGFIVNSPALKVIFGNGGNGVSGGGGGGGGGIAFGGVISATTGNGNNGGTASGTTGGGGGNFVGPIVLKTGTGGIGGTSTNATGGNGAIVQAVLVFTGGNGGNGGAHSGGNGGLPGIINANGANGGDGTGSGTGANGGAGGTLGISGGASSTTFAGGNAGSVTLTGTAASGSTAGINGGSLTLSNAVNTIAVTDASNSGFLLTLPKITDTILTTTTAVVQSVTSANGLTLTGSTLAFSGAAYAPLASPALTGTPTAPTAAANTNTTQLATTAFVIGQAYATLASPTFTGTPLAPTAAANTNTTQLATTAFVIGQGYTAAVGANPTATVGQAAINGSATTFMRSDAAPVLDPATSDGALLYAAHSFGAP